MGAAATGSRPELVFWFEFASSYSYLSAMRIEAAAAATGVALRWRPFPLGPIFAAQGWTDSPFNIYPAKGAYMWRDMERRCTAYGLPLKRPPGFPQNSLHAARIALAALETPAGPRYCKAIYRAAFAQGRDIAAPEVLAEALAEAGLPQDLVQAAKHPARKAAYKQAGVAAGAHGIFGAPSFTVGDELFWGDDRLEDALAWASRAALPNGAAGSMPNG